jgi:hypothetical protein
MKTASLKLLLNVVALIAGVGGVTLIWIHSNVYVAIGVILMIYGNNLSNKAELK